MPGIQCAGCNRFASATEGVKCGNNRCRRLYHRGCVGFKPDVAVPASWRCPECKKNQVRDNRAETPVRGSAGSAGDPASQACVVARTTDEFDVSGSGPAPVVCEQQYSGHQHLRRCVGTPLQLLSRHGKFPLSLALTWACLWWS
ncbi:hypothetical protein HF086_012673 [Spodoptera exigua]|uniref:Zinc finger PHD-type domain-containing protein n=1 Tax=Spodoptera exigua TaxID=7107 RepID=A0A922SL09_SPOEX|nr:hypothetical protein HF086_012673 [Spodoptera exigua]